MAAKKRTTKKKAAKRSKRKPVRSSSKRKPLPGSPAPRPPGLTSQRAIAAHFDRSVSTVNGWIHTRGWPFGKPSPSNPIGIADIADWIDRTLTKTKADVGIDDPVESLRAKFKELDPLKLIKIQKLKRESELLKKKLEAMEELYIDKAEAKIEINAIIQSTKSALVALPRTSSEVLDSLGLLAKGKRKTVEAELDAIIQSLLLRFSNAMNNVTTRKPNQKPHRRRRA